MKTLRLEFSRELGFDEARALANREAGKYVGDPLILGWLNRKTGQHSPDVDCCQEDGRETWEIYAESRGAW